MKQILLEVWLTVESRKDAEEIAHDIHEILGNNGITNSVKITHEGEDD